MGTVTNISRANFSVGDLIHHRLFDYRGVIVDVDSKCQAPDQWYETVATSRPPKDKPWYHVLVHGTQITTYAAESSLQEDFGGLPVEHPLVEAFFSEFTGEAYVRNERCWLQA